ncbi:hypothetical protein ACHWQZ_G018303 [Mnemiopsis leidyi]
MSYHLAPVLARFLANSLTLSSTMFALPVKSAASSKIYFCQVFPKKAPTGVGLYTKLHVVKILYGGANFYVTYSILPCPIRFNHAISKTVSLSGAFQSNESNRLSLRRFVSSSTIGYDCSAQKRSSSVSRYSLSLCYSDIPLLFFLMKCFGSCIIFGDEDCSADPQEKISVYG